MHRLPLWLAALWWGSLTTVGFLVVPMLFAYLPAKALAGNMAAHLFSAQTAVGVVCGLLLLLLGRRLEEYKENQALSLANAIKEATVFIVGGVLLALLSEFAVAPRIVARDNLPLWHSVGSAMYLAQWLCAAWVLHKLSAPPKLPGQTDTASSDQV